MNWMTVKIVTYLSHILSVNCKTAVMTLNLRCLYWKLKIHATLTLVILCAIIIKYNYNTDNITELSIGLDYYIDSPQKLLNL